MEVSGQLYNYTILYQGKDFEKSTVNELNRLYSWSGYCEEIPKPLPKIKPWPLSS
jgi:hypothetical protein